MTWTALGRFDVVNNEEVSLPYDLVLAVSDMLEEETKRKR
jgi:hypothetical protein